MFDYYNPQSTYFPRQQSFPMQQPSQMGIQQPQMTMMPPVGLTRVTGMDGAKAFQMPPNSVAALFDGGEDIFYIKSTDGAGFPTIKAFGFSPLQETVAFGTGYATVEELEAIKAEINELKGALTNVKQPVRGKTKTDAED